MLFEEFAFNYFSGSLFLGGIIAIASGAAVYFTKTPRDIGFPWMLVNLSTAVWSFGYFLMITSTSGDRALLANWILHAGAVFIPVLYLFFILALTDTFQRYKKIFYALFVPLLFFTLVNPTTYFIQAVKPKFIFNYAPDAGPLYVFFTIYFFAVVLFALFILLKKALTTNGLDIARLRLVFLSSVFGFLGGGSVFFLTFNIQIPPYLIILFALYPIVITYAIVKFRLFNTKIVTTEIFTFTIWILLLFQVFLAENFSKQMINLVILALTVILGIFLIRSVVREVEQREEIERLAKNLEKANVKLKDLDKLKSQFLSIASHDLRAPLSSIRNFMSLLLEGTYGKLPPAAEEGTRQVFERATDMAKMVDDYLNVSRIEQGSMKYDFAPADLAKIVSESVESLKQNAEQKHLDLSFFIPSGIQKIPINADIGRLREVFSNLIDNSIKYTLDGSIRVLIEGGDKTARVIIQDTGVGVTEDTKKKLFKLFSPGEYSRRINPSSTGVGLYVVKKHVEAHGGKVWVESEGEGKGSRFYVELPITFTPGQMDVNKFANDL